MKKKKKREKRMYPRNNAHAHFVYTTYTHDIPRVSRKKHKRGVGGKKGNDFHVALCVIRIHADTYTRVFTRVFYYKQKRKMKKKM